MEQFLDHTTDIQIKPTKKDILDYLFYCHMLLNYLIIKKQKKNIYKYLLVISIIM